MSDKPDRLSFFRVHMWPVAVISMLMQHKDGIAFGLVNLAIVALVVLALSVAISFIRRAKP